MKNKYDPRHIRRLKIMQTLFAVQFGHQQPDSDDVKDIISNLKTIDEYISQNAPKWPIDKINRVDLAILRLAFWEIVFKKETPYKVIIDEAIELAKEFGSESSPSFINGVLGSALKSLNLEQNQNEPA